MNTDEVIKIGYEDFINKILSNKLDSYIVDEYIENVRKKDRLLKFKAVIDSKIRNITSSYIWEKGTTLQDKIRKIEKKPLRTNDENIILEQLKDKKTIFDKEVHKYQNGNKNQLFPNSDYDCLGYFKDNHNEIELYGYILLYIYNQIELKIKERERENKPPQLTKDLKTEVQKNPPQPKELTQDKIEKLKEHFNSNFKGIGNSENLFDILFIPYLKDIIQYNNAKKCARVALIIYKSKYFKKTTKISFNKWRNEFYDIMGIENKTVYKENQICKGSDFNELKNKFAYFDY